MASRTQLRLAQVTGSFGDFEGGIVDNLPVAATLAAIPAGSGSMVSAMSELASSIQRIHGGAAFTTNAAGLFSHNLTIAGTTPKITIGDGGTEDTALVFDGNAQDYYCGIDDDDDKLYIGLGSTVGANPAITVDTSGDVTLAGNLTVSGDTTTINVANLTVEDSIIALGITGSTFTNQGDRGILFARSAAATDALPGLWYDLANSDFNFAKTVTGPLSQSFGATSAYTNLNAGNLGVYANAVLGGTLEIGSGVTLNDLVLSSAAGNDLRLDSNSGKVFVDEAGTERGYMGFDAAGGFFLSSSAGQGLLLDGNMGLISLGQDNAGGGGNGVGLVLGDKSMQMEQLSYNPDGGGIAYKFTHNDAYASQFMQVSGSIRFMEPNQGGHYVELKTAAVAGDVSLTLPGTEGAAANEIMVTDGFGVLSFKSSTTLGLSGAPTKAIRIVTGSGFAPGATVDLGGGLVRDQSSGINNLSLADSQGSTLDVFVNGQILLSGSEAQVTSNPPSADFMIDATGSISFCFALEADDVIQVIKR